MKESDAAAREEIRQKKGIKPEGRYEKAVWKKPSESRAHRDGAHADLNTFSIVLVMASF